MRHYPRKPALLILLAAACALGGVWAGRLAMARAPMAGATLEQLELAVAEADAGPATWLAYARRLEEAGRFAHAAAAYRKVLEDDPTCAPARAGCATALAGVGDGRQLQAYLTGLVYQEPQLVLDLLQRPACRRCLGDAAAAALAGEARLQLMD